MIKSVFFSRFDRDKGPVVLHQVPEGSITPNQQSWNKVALPLLSPPTLSSPRPITSPPTRSSLNTPHSQRPPSNPFASENVASVAPRQPLFDFASVSDFIIPRQEFCNQLLTVCANHYRIIGFPVCIHDDTRYAWNRNEYIFNFCIVLDEYADASAYIKVVKRVARMLRVLEEEGSFLSGDENTESEHMAEMERTLRLERAEGDGVHDLDHESEPDQSSAGHQEENGRANAAAEIVISPSEELGHEDEDDDDTDESRSHGKVYALCEMLLEDLNNYSECMIPVDGTTTLSIRLAPTLPPPPAVRAWHVPVPTVRLSQLTDSNWDLTMLALLPHIDGTYTVAAAARRANTRLELARAAVQDLLYYGCVILLDAFTFGAVYAPTPLITAFVADNNTSDSGTADEDADEDEQPAKLSALNGHTNGDAPNKANTKVKSSSQQAECAAFVARPGCTVSPDEVVTLYCSLRPGLALRHWCAEPSRVEVLARVDVRRLISFGVIGGFLYRVHRYATVPLRSQPASTATLAAAAAATKDTGTGTRTSTSRSPGSDVTVGAGGKGSKRDQVLPLARYLDGLHCFDEMCTELGMGERQVLGKVRGHGEVFLMAR